MGISSVKMLDKIEITFIILIHLKIKKGNYTMTKSITPEDKKTVIEMMTAAGWEYCDHSESNREIFGYDFSLFFTIPLSQDDLNKTMKRIGKNHFTPRGYRSVSIFSRYATSDIRGTFRGYRCRNETQDYDVSNIFAYVKGDNIVEHTKAFLEAYNNLDYNIR